MTCCDLLGRVSVVLIELPWPQKVLSPNVSVHWAVLAKAKKLYSQECFWFTVGAIPKGGRPVFFGGKIRVNIVFHPPSRRKYDRDNLISRLKAGQDGIARALKVDDSRFVPTYDIGDVVNGGKVVFEIIEE